MTHHTASMSSPEALRMALHHIQEAPDASFSFEGKSVADIGTANAEYAAIPLELHAHHVTYVAAEAGHLLVAALADAGAIPAGVNVSTTQETAAQVAAGDGQPAFDIVTIWNISRSNTDNALRAASGLVMPGGQILVTGIGLGLVSQVTAIESSLLPLFETVETRALLRKPHTVSNTLTIATKAALPETMPVAPNVPPMTDEAWLRTVVAGDPVGGYTGDPNAQRELIAHFRTQGIHSPYHFNPGALQT